MFCLQGVTVVIQTQLHLSWTCRRVILRTVLTVTLAGIHLQIFILLFSSIDVLISSKILCLILIYEISTVRIFNILFIHLVLWMLEIFGPFLLGNKHLDDLAVLVFPMIRIQQSTFFNHRSLVHQI